MDFAVANEKDRFQASLLGGDLDALRERRSDGSSTYRVSTAQPDGCREVGLMVGMCAREISEHDVSRGFHLRKRRETQGLCDLHTLKVAIAIDSRIQAGLENGAAKITIN
jgi:hypothetical protein